MVFKISTRGAGVLDLFLLNLEGVHQMFHEVLESLKVIHIRRQLWMEEDI